MVIKGNSVVLEKILSLPFQGTTFVPRVSVTVTIGFCFSLPVGKLVSCSDTLFWQ